MDWATLWPIFLGENDLVALRLDCSRRHFYAFLLLRAETINCENIFRPQDKSDASPIKKHLPKDRAKKKS
jgi:hypothetical protein